jgi:hypothetical protein
MIGQPFVAGNLRVLLLQLNIMLTDDAKNVLYIF